MPRTHVKRLLLFTGVVAALAGVLVPLSAGSGKASGITDGPYAATTPDSGTCGNNWAIDLFSRSFNIKPQGGGWVVTQTFKNGRFITLGDGQSGAASSPGACDGHPDNGNTLKEGVQGSFSGTFTITVNPGFTFTGAGGCGALSDWPQGAGNGSTPGDCTTGQWIATHFPGAVYGTDANVTAYHLTYKAINKTWVNDNIANSGDICTTGPC